MAKAKKQYVLTDNFKLVVNEGDEVILLVKERGFGCIRDAYLAHCLYVGHCQYGYQFVDVKCKNKWEQNPDYYKGHYEKSLNLREPECIKLSKGKVLGFFNK